MGQNQVRLEYGHSKIIDTTTGKRNSNISSKDKAVGQSFFVFSSQGFVIVKWWGAYRYLASMSDILKRLNYRYHHLRLSSQVRTGTIYHCQVFSISFFQAFNHQII